MKLSLDDGATWIDASARIRAGGEGALARPDFVFTGEGIIKDLWQGPNLTRVGTSSGLYDDIAADLGLHCAGAA